MAWVWLYTLADGAPTTASGSHSIGSVVSVFCFASMLSTAASLRACLESACLPQEGSLLPLPTPSRGGPAVPAPLPKREWLRCRRAAPCQPDNWCLIPRSALAPARHAPLLARLQPRPLP